MSLEVRPGDLPGALAACEVVHLLTTVPDRPHAHVGAVTAVVGDGVVRVTGAGRTARDDVVGRAEVTLLGSPAEVGGYSSAVSDTSGRRLPESGSSRRRPSWRASATTPSTPA